MKKISRLFSKNKTKDDKQEKELAKLIQVMNEIMTLEMLQILCSELGITYEAFPGNSKTQKTKEVVIYFSRPPQVMDDLYEYLYKIRPDIPWKNILTYKRKPLSLPETARLAQIISYSNC